MLGLCHARPNAFFIEWADWIIANKSQTTELRDAEGQRFFLFNLAS